MCKLRSTPALVALILLVMGGGAEAHKLKVFATVTGAVIEGYAYFSPGGRANTVSVTLATNDGVVQAKAITDAEGNFRFEATRRADYVITVDAGDGHVASTTIAAEDLPQTLSFASGDAAAVRPDERAAAETTPAPPPRAAGDAELRAFIDQSISRQIRPLREQIDAYQEKIWWHDVLGGLGYILGLGGIAFGLSERRKRANAVRSDLTTALS